MMQKFAFVELGFTIWIECQSTYTTPMQSPLMSAY